ncbi:hypothetical protein [Aliiroseovarius sp. F20344]|uniref:hypothetical protein n=1 Tax=Aliiroseovarius sp. F20344 TaxID=2926414 RepID=UPI001FF69B6E|nr:hypothetical protein [Aliiroseovarius sp. F20344]MCK0143851.1 hypothetical protein [Aliiroseovarius sp. F20344]
MIYRATLFFLMLTTPSFADVTGPGGKVIDCYCTDSQGGRVELGQSICLFVDGRAFMALCDMSLNVPIWRDTGQGCVSSRGSEEQFNPLPHSTPINPNI